MTAMHGGILILPADFDVPLAETPAMHIRNALMMVRFIEQLSPTTWVFNPELGRACRRAEAALVIIEHNGPVRLSLAHLHSAIQALLEADLDWDVIRELPNACVRLLSADFLLQAES